MSDSTKCPECGGEMSVWNVGQLGEPHCENCGTVARDIDVPTKVAADSGDDWLDEIFDEVGGVTIMNRPKLKQAINDHIREALLAEFPKKRAFEGKYNLGIDLCIQALDKVVPEL